MLGADVTAMDDSSGSGNNFKIVAPVTGASDGDAVTYTVTVDGQTPTTEGAYTLEMDFKVAMQDKTPGQHNGVDPTPITPPGVS